MNKIIPSVGRQVWYRPGNRENMVVREQPLAATVVYVWSSSMVNLVVLDADGNSYQRTSVHLVQDGEETPPPEANFCQWMPYQVKKAAEEDEGPLSVGPTFFASVDYLRQGKIIAVDTSSVAQLTAVMSSMTSLAESQTAIGARGEAGFATTAGEGADLRNANPANAVGDLADGSGQQPDAGSDVSTGLTD